MLIFLANAGIIDLNKMFLTSISWIDRSNSMDSDQEMDPKMRCFRREGLFLIDEFE